MAHVTGFLESCALAERPGDPGRGSTAGWLQQYRETMAATKTRAQPRAMGKGRWQERSRSEDPLNSVAIGWQGRAGNRC